MSSWRRRATSTRRRSGGYYVSPVERPLQAAARQPAPAAAGAGAEDLFSGPCDQFHRPGVFSLYRLGPPHAGDAAGADKALLQAAPYNGAEELRRAISDYLRQFRGMNVDSGQIIVGAGTEFLYSLLIQLLGREKCYAVGGPRIQQNYGNLPLSGESAAGGTG